MLWRFELMGGETNEPLATLAGFRDHPEFGPLFGMNLVTVREGLVRVGDRVEIVG